MKRFFAAALSLCMILSLCACSSKPKTASELFSLVQTAMEDTSYSIDGKIDMDLSVGVSGLSMDIPITMDLSGDIFGDSSHGLVTASFEAFGQSAEVPMEFYTTADKSYSYSEGTWTVTDASEASSGISSAAAGLLDSSLFAQADMSEDEGVYTVILSLSQVDPDILLSLFEATGEQPADLPVDGLTDALANGTITYIITADGDSYMPYSISIDNVDGEFEQDGSSYSIGLSMYLEFSNYGGVTEADVAIPEDVIQAAIPATETDDGSGSLLPGDLTGETDGSFLEESEPSLPQEPEIDEDPIVPGDSVLSGSSTGELTAEKLFATYNGELLIPGQFYLDTFLDEFTYDPNELGTYMFLPLEYKANDVVSLYIYGLDNDSSHLDSEPLYGYDFEYISGYGEDGLPDVSFGGLTWGASETDVTAVYGEPDSYSVSSGMWTMSYTTEEDENGLVYTLTFSGDDSGIYSMSMDSYEW